MQNFDFNEALKAIQSGKPITGSDGVLAPLIKQLTEAAQTLCPFKGLLTKTRMM